MKKFIIILLVMCFPAVVYARSGDGNAIQSILQPHPVVSDPLYWANTISLVLALLIIILIIIRFVSARMRIYMPSENVQRLVYLLLIPAFILPVASFATFEDSTKVEVCGSCHSAMGIYVNDMKNKESKTLAAAHYQNRFIQHGQCYACHAGYKVVDIGKAKGKGLVHLYYWITNSPTGRGDKQIKLYEKGGYKNSVCLGCHAGSAVFLEAGEGVHRRAAAYLVENPDTGVSRMSCLKCHGPAHQSLIESHTPETFTGKGLVCGRQGMNLYVGGEPGSNPNNDRPYEGAPPAIPHKSKEYTIDKEANTCLNECHIKGLESVPASHLTNAQTGGSLQNELDSARYNCLQCHAPASGEKPIISQIEHFKVTDAFPRYTAKLIPWEKKVYQGAAMCELCHSITKIGDQYGKWKKTNHARAYDDLATENGYKIARQMGVKEEPQKSGQCLVCHSTGYNSGAERNAMFRIEDGIQCEQCHGAGNNYIRLNTMRRIFQGELDPESVGQSKPNRETCMECHEQKHDHILPFVEEERFKKIAH